MDVLNAPWRMKYIDKSNKEKIDCIFCEFIKEREDEKRLILYRGKKAFVMFNAFPYNPGHLMVAPYRHTGNYDELNQEEILEINLLVQKCLKVLKKTMDPHGFNIGINMGKVAGAGFEGHVHVHVVPRWEGDTNFMPVVGETKVIPEALDVTYRKLKEAWEE
ncbi:HIT domain-containing protein [Acetomicrobium sp.]|uniref:HIT family protein n=1 Tax=Acetomicrobium sp. TaxID=1872099 RepID=UPI001BCAAC4E|nr:HIT domain-containing protein [Acetomicrobium sp.]